jgi:hypothetical protein
MNDAVVAKSWRGTAVLRIDEYRVDWATPGN